MSRYSVGDVVVEDRTGDFYTIVRVCRGAYTIVPKSDPHRSYEAPINWADANMSPHSVPLQAGDVVKMLKTSRYTPAKMNPFDVDGTILECYMYGDELCYRVKWANGKSNGCYNIRDIGLVSSNSVTISSLDYMQDGNLTVEDKEIIKEALSNV
jgi:hypothetical protein